MNLHRLLMQSLVWRGVYFITTFLLIIFLSRYLEAGGAGWIFYLTFLFSLMLLVGSISMESAVTYYASNGKINQHKLAWLSVLWTIAVGIITFLAILFYFGELKNESAITQKQYLFFALTYICGILLTNFFTALFYAQRNFFLPNILMSILNVIIIVIVTSAGKLGLHINTVLNIYFLSFLVQGIALFLVYSIRNNNWFQFSLPVRSETTLLLRYSLLALAANVVFFLVYRADYWFVRHSPASETEDLGNYIQVSKLGQMLLIIPQIMASAVFPHTAAEIDRQQVRDTVTMLSRGFFVMYIVIIAFVAVTGEWLFPFVYGATFNKMYLPMLLILPGIWALTVMVLLAAYFSGKGNVKINVYGGILSVIIVLAGNYIFTFRYGMIAAAIISTVAYLAYLFFLLIRFLKEYNLPLADFFIPRKTDLQFLKQLIKKISFAK